MTQAEQREPNVGEFRRVLLDEPQRTRIARFLGVEVAMIDLRSFAASQRRFWPPGLPQFDYIGLSVGDLRAIIRESPQKRKICLPFSEGKTVLVDEDCNVTVTAGSVNFDCNLNKKDYFPLQAELMVATLLFLPAEVLSKVAETESCLAVVIYRAHLLEKVPEVELITISHETKQEGRFSVSITHPDEIKTTIAGKDKLLVVSVPDIGPYAGISRWQYCRDLGDA